ncbi:VOC family protein [Vibrio anguillarum]|uniref:VOC family protein n=1 Tax=Vibrio anguillarum TaxID=55601 RepID=UPI0030EEEF14
MKYYQGRLIDHVHLKVSNFECSLSFYKSILYPLGLEFEFDVNTRSFFLDELYVSEDSSRPTQGLHLAFQAQSEEAVNAFYEAGLRIGSTCNGSPGFRNYHAGYYACYLLDPDGNNIEAKFDSLAEKAADSVEVTRRKNA